MTPSGNPQNNPTTSGIKRLDPDTLYWSETGEVDCGKHAPYPGSDTWVRGRWSKVPKAAIADMGGTLTCEVCVGIERRKAGAR